MKSRATVATLLGVAMLLSAARPQLAAARYPDDPIFDFRRIIEEPLDARVVEAIEKDGIVVERIEYTSMVRDGKPDRIVGILARPKRGTGLPAVFWSQGGMSAADEGFVSLFARKGYVSLNVTLDHTMRGSWGRFDTSDPANANLTRLAIDQMRGITYLTQRPEVDKERIGVGGSSYGGFYSTLISGADPRVRAGMAFFSGGHHEMGTNLPQFCLLETAADVDVWRKTIDPAWRLAKRDVPFLWGIASNDNWFHLPAVVKTYEEAIGDKRAIIWPQWQHGFPEQVDAALVDWYDIHLAKTRAPYNEVQPITVRNEGDSLVARWGWTGLNTVAKAEVIVAYGRSIPWHEWVYRHHEVFPATISGSAASAEIPLPEKDIECYVYGTITDDRDVPISTMPVIVAPAALGITRATAARMVVNGAFYGDFEPGSMSFLRGCMAFALPSDTQVAHGGTQSVRIETQDPRRPATARLKLGHVPGRSHVLKLWLRADRPETPVQVMVSAPPPANGTSKVVALLRQSAAAAAGVESHDLPATPLEWATRTTVGPEWQHCTLAVPCAGAPIEGYNLTVRHVGDPPAPAAGGPLTPARPPVIWLDDLRFEPVWHR